MYILYYDLQSFLKLENPDHVVKGDGFQLQIALLGAGNLL